MEEQASGDNVVPSPVYEDARTREYGTAVLPPRYQPFKVDDGAVLSGPRTSPWSIDHTSEQSQNRSKRTDRGFQASQLF